jgi:large conductance mechanosensitive channel
MESPFKALPKLNPAKQAFSLVDEFKQFAFKGNVIDLAVGVIIGAAFGTIVKSMVDNIIMPLVNLALPTNSSYKEWVIALGGDSKPLPIGLFLADVINFLIVALALFLFTVKFLGWIMKAKAQEAVAAPPPLTKDQELLIEIRDLLAKKPPA